MPETRECGECQACCHALLIYDPPSETGENCAYQCDTGCGIYSTRPETCRAWSCSWLVGHCQEGAPWGTEAQRPDKLGLIFSSRTHRQTIAREVRPGASKEAAGQAAIAEWTQDVPLVLVFNYASKTELCDDWQPRHALPQDPTKRLPAAGLG